MSQPDTRPLILVTNDDGIESPGLAAAAAALDPLGELLIVAPLEQQTSMSRSRSQQAGGDGRLHPRTVRYGDQAWPGYGVRASPALTVTHALLRLAARPVALAVSGINYGENTGSCVTVSGTIGAALEAAEQGIPAMAVSLETAPAQYFDHIAADFSAAMHYVRFLAERMLNRTLLPDVDVLKVEVPASATVDSGWMVVRQDRMMYYRPALAPGTEGLDANGRFEYHVAKGQYSAEDTDTYALAKGLIAVTPLSIDLTSRVDLGELRRLLE